MGKENVTLDVLLDITSSDWISPHIKTHCMGAKDGTYSKREELEALVSTRVSAPSLNQNNVNELDGASVEAHEQFLRTVKPFPLADLDCSSTSRDQSKPCLCEIDICIGELFLSWYTFFINASWFIVPEFHVFIFYSLVSMRFEILP